MIYQMVVTQTRSTVVSVEADSMEEAERKLKKKLVNDPQYVDSILGEESILTVESA